MIAKDGQQQIGHIGVFWFKQTSLSEMITQHDYRAKKPTISTHNPRDGPPRHPPLVTIATSQPYLCATQHICVAIMLCYNGGALYSGMERRLLHLARPHDAAHVALGTTVGVECVARHAQDYRYNVATSNLTATSH